MRKLWVVLGILGGLVLASALAIPYFVNAESQRDVLASRLEASLGRKVKLGAIRLGLFPPALQVSDTQIAEALGFTGPAFSTAKQLRARVRLFPLLRGRLEVPWIELEQPTIHLIKNARGEWNFANLGTAARPGAASPTGPEAASPTRPLEIGELRIRDGLVTVTDLEKHRPTVTLDRISVSVKNFSPERPFDWEVSLHPPGPDNARISAEGTGGPLNRVNLALSPANGAAKFKNIELGQLSAFTEQPGLAGLFNGETKFSGDGGRAQAEGSYRVEHLRLSSTGRAAPTPIAGRFNVRYDGGAEELVVKQFELGSGQAMARTMGRLRFRKATEADLETRVSNAPLPDVAKLLPAAGVRLPAGSSLSGGALSAFLRVTGAFPQPRRTGSLELKNARLENYNVAGQLGSVVKIAGVNTGGKDTVIDQFKTEFASDGAYTKLQNLLLAIPGMNITGEGGFADAGPLDFRGIATLTQAGSTVGGLLQRVTGSSDTVPFRVSGTLEHPSFQPDVGKILAQHAEQQPGGAGKLLKGLGGLFQKK